MSRRTNCYHDEFAEQLAVLQYLPKETKERLENLSESYGQGEPLTAEDLVLLSNVFDLMPPLATEVTVYRGIEGEVITSNPVIFTTFQQSWAYNFVDRVSGNMLLEIILPIGIKVIPWSNIVSNYLECEVLLDGSMVRMLPTAEVTFVRAEFGDVKKMRCALVPV
jgi:hypothetical protein